MEKTSQTKKIVGIVAALVVIILVFAGIYVFFGPKGTKGAKAITIEVVHKDGTTKEFDVNTDEEFLGPVLLQEKIADGESGEYGLFIKTVDGETADDSNQEWWCITKGGETVMTGVDSTPIEDGDTFEITLTVGY